MVSSELGVDGSQGSVLEGLRLLDTVLVGLLCLVVVGVVLRLRHVAWNVSTQLTKKKRLVTKVRRQQETEKTAETKGDDNSWVQDVNSFIVRNWDIPSMCWRKERERIMRVGNFST